MRLCAGRLHCGRYRYPLEALEAFRGLVACHSAGTKKPRQSRRTTGA
nr:MAG TPA: hypothetical protein [Caudoviricetes sp.]